MTTGVAILEQPALVLNRHWVPIHLTTAKHAIGLVYQCVARAVDPVDCSLHRFQSWSDLRVPEDVELALGEMAQDQQPVLIGERLEKLGSLLGCDAQNHVGIWRLGHGGPSS